MLKPAADVARVSAAAQQEALGREDEARRISAASAAEKARLEETYREFFRVAMSAARVGKQTLVVLGHELNLERLHQEGFVAKQLTRRSEYELHLARLSASKLADVIRECDRVVLDCEGLVRFQGDGMHHRNPLVSLMETVWRAQGQKELLDVELLAAYTNVESLAQPSAWELVKPKLKRVLEQFEETKKIEAKHRTVCWENLQIPLNEDKATLVSWESSDDGGGVVEAFSAKRLKWLTTHWPVLSELVGEWIDEASSNGETSLDLFLKKVDSEWKVSVEMPPGWTESATAEEDVAWWRDDSDDCFDFCAPNLVAAELKALGYSVFSEPATPADGSAPSAEAGIASCRLRICWTES